MDRASWIADELAEREFAIVDDWIGAAHAGRAAVALQGLHAEGSFQRAAVGVDRVVDDGVRADETQWLDPDTAPADLLPLLVSFDELRAALSASLLLPLVEIECHAALYPPEAIYAPHVDDLRGSTCRRVSFVWYANPGWTPDDGGALRLYLAGETDCFPVLDRLVVFRSDTVLHEVLPPRRARWSITGWMRVCDPRPFGVVQGLKG